MSSVMLQTELPLRILPVCVRSQRVIKVNNKDNRHSNEKKGHFDWEKTSSNDNPDNPSHGKALCFSKDICVCIPLCALPTPLREPYLPILWAEKLRFSVQERSRMQKHISKTKISPRLKQIVSPQTHRSKQDANSLKDRNLEKKLLMISAEKFNTMHSTQPPVFEILMGIDLNPTALKNTASPPTFIAKAKISPCSKCFSKQTLGAVSGRKIQA